MVEYILWAFMTWVPTADVEIQKRVAEEIVEAVRLEDGTFAEAMILASLARNEGGFASWVGDGSCNRKVWRDAHPGLSGCDGGNAFGWFQIHPGAGIALADGVGIGVELAPYGRGPWLRGQDLLDRPVTAARIALRLVRYSLKRAGDLRLYTGERGTFPKAIYRIEMAERFRREHPFYDWMGVAWP